MTPKRLKYPIARVLATGAFASLAMLAACEAKLPTSDQVDQMTASTATATAAAGYVLKLDTAKVTYYIDGRTATKAEAEKLAAEQIATVNVSQKGTQSGGEVRIVTRESAKPVSGAGDQIDTMPTRMTYTRSDTARVRMTTFSDSSSPIRTTYTRNDSTSVTIATPNARVTLRGDKESRERALAAGINNARQFTGLMIVDGVITDPAVANSIAPDQILSVNVMKGVAASSQYSDPRAVNGVIQIVTKHPVKR